MEVKESNVLPQDIGKRHYPNLSRQPVGNNGEQEDMEIVIDDDDDRAHGNSNGNPHGRVYECFRAIGHFYSRWQSAGSSVIRCINQLAFSGIGMYFLSLSGLPTL